MSDKEELRFRARSLENSCLSGQMIARRILAAIDSGDDLQDYLDQAIINSKCVDLNIDGLLLLSGRGLPSQVRRDVLARFGQGGES